MTKISDLKLDPHNPNLGNERGNAMIEKSIEDFGFLDPGVITADGYILHGNKRTIAAQVQGMEDAIIIDHDGESPIYIRTKHKLVEGTEEEIMEARLASIALNRTAQVNITFDPNITEAIGDNELAPFFEESELPHLENFKIEEAPKKKSSPIRKKSKFIVYLEFDNELDQIDAVEMLEEMGYSVTTTNI